MLALLLETISDTTYIEMNHCPSSQLAYSSAPCVLCILMKRLMHTHEQYRSTHWTVNRWKTFSPLPLFWNVSMHLIKKHHTSKNKNKANSRRDKQELKNWSNRIFNIEHWLKRYHLSCTEKLTFVIEVCIIAWTSVLCIRTAFSEWPIKIIVRTLLQAPVCHAASNCKTNNVCYKTVGTHYTRRHAVETWTREMF